MSLVWMRYYASQNTCFLGSKIVSPNSQAHWGQYKIGMLKLIMLVDFFPSFFFNTTSLLNEQMMVKHTAFIILGVTSETVTPWPY